MTRRRFADDEEAEVAVESHSETGIEEEEDTQEEAFNKYSDFDDDKRKKPSLPPRPTKKTKSRRTSIVNKQQGFSWDSMLAEFQSFARQRNISQQQITVGLFIVGFLVFYSFLSSLLSFRGRLETVSVGGDLLTCVSTDSRNRNLIECSVRNGYKLDVIRANPTSIIIRVGEDETSETFGLVGIVFTVLKYIIYLTLGTITGIFLISSDGASKLKMLQKKYHELTNEIKTLLEKRINNKGAAKSAPVFSETEDEQSQTEVSEEEDD